MATSAYILLDDTATAAPAGRSGARQRIACGVGPREKSFWQRWQEWSDGRALEAA